VSYAVVLARLNTVAAVIVAGSCVIEIGTVAAGLAGSSLGNCAETPVPTCLPDA
jgi:hypothetical protein